MADEYCPECGAKITGSTGFCSECGAVTASLQNSINEAEKAKIEAEKRKKEKQKQDREEFKKTIKKNKKWISIGVVLIILISVVLMLMPADTSNRVYECDKYSVEYPYNFTQQNHDGGDGYFWDNEMKEGITIHGGVNEDITICHHNAHGKDLDYYADKFKEWKDNTDVKKITVNGVSAYDFIGATAITDHWVIFVKDDECYLITFESTVDDNVRNLIINSFESK